MKTLLETLQQLTMTVELTDAQLKSFINEFEQNYENFVLDFIFSLENNCYTAYNGTFMSKVKIYFKDLYLKYQFAENDLLLSSAFIYKFFIELENKHSTHNYKVMSPFTINELVTRKDKTYGIEHNTVHLKFKNVKDIGNSALFMVLAIINSGFTVKLKEIDEVMKSNGMHFMFHKKSLSRTLPGGLEATINEIIDKKFITIENLAIISFMQTFVLEDVEHALCSMRTHPQMLGDNASYAATTLGTVNGIPKQLWNSRSKINLLFPEVIVNRGSIFNILIGNTTTLIEREYQKGTLTNFDIFLIELNFLHTIKRFNHTLNNPAENLNGLLNFYYRRKIEGHSAIPNFTVTRNSNSSTFYSLDFQQILKQSLHNSNTDMLIATITKHGLTSYIEENLPMMVINNQGKGFCFDTFYLINEIEEALNNVVDVYDTYNKFSKTLNEFSVAMLKMEIAGFKQIDIAMSNSHEDKLYHVAMQDMLDDVDFLNDYFTTPFFLMDAITSPVKISSMYVNDYRSYLTRLNKVKTIEVEPLTFFMDAANFDQVSYINGLLQLEINSQLRLLKYSNYFLIYPQLLKFKFNVERGNHYRSELDMSFISKSVSKILSVAIDQYIGVCPEPSTLFLLSYLNERYTPLDLSGVVTREFLLMKFNKEVVTEFPQLLTTSTLIYQLSMISSLMYKVFSRKVRNSERPFIDILSKIMVDEVNLVNTSSTYIRQVLDNMSYYNHTTGKIDNLIPMSERTQDLHERILIDMTDELATSNYEQDIRAMYFNETYGKVLVSDFANKLYGLVKTGSDEIVVTNLPKSETNMRLSIVDLLVHDTSKNTNIYTDRVKDVQSGNNIISTHGEDLNLRN